MHSSRCFLSTVANVVTGNLGIQVQESCGCMGKFSSIVVGLVVSSYSGEQKYW